MNENINLCEILKGHEGETFYSPIFGNVTLIHSNNGNATYPIQVLPIDCTDRNLQFNKIGMFWGEDYPNGECMLFPSKDQRDWNIWVEEQKPKTPKTWDELINDGELCLCKGYDFAVDVTGHNGKGWTRRKTPIEKSALALLKIHQLIEVGYGGNVSNDEWNKTKPYVILYNDDNFNITLCWTKQMIAFHTQEQAEEFLSYPKNVQLLKDYFMV